MSNRSKKKYSLFFKSILITIFYLMPFNTFAQSRIDISVNRNVELIMAMQVLTNMDDFIITNGFSNFPLTTKFEFPLKNKYLSYFSQFKDSQAIKLFNTMIPNGFFFGKPLTAAVLSDSNLKLTNTCWIESLPSPPYPPDYKYVVEEFLDQAFKFKEFSGFDNFFDSIYPLYDSIVNIQKSKVSLESIVSDIELFFYNQLPGYHVVLVPLMWSGGVSISSKTPCNTKFGETWILIGPKNVVNGIPSFGTNEEYTDVIVHEFCHAFITPLCDQYKEEIMKYEYLYNLQKNIFRNNGIPGWFDAVNELLTRAAEIIITSKGDQKQIETKLQFQTEKLGFEYLPILVKAISKYHYQEKKKIEDSFVEILNSFSTIKI